MSKKDITQDIVEYVTRKYNYWNMYVTTLDEETSNIEGIREEFTKKFKENPENTDMIKDFQTRVMEYQAKVLDANILEQSLLALYKLTEIIGLKSKIDEDIVNRLETMKSNEKEINFAVDERGFHPIDKQALKQKIDQALGEVDNLLKDVKI